jgi:site-specific recombinase XerC
LLGAYLGHSNASTTMGYTKLATRYVTAVKDWPRGEFRLET